MTQKYGSPGAQTLRVATTYIHHNHNSQTLDNDIAILKLHGEADLKEGVCLVCLPARGTSQQAGKKCTVTGYGYMGESELLQLVQVVQWRRRSRILYSKGLSSLENLSKTMKNVSFSIDNKGIIRPAGSSNGRTIRQDDYLHLPTFYVRSSHFANWQDLIWII